jgi:hypothetical protein
VKENVLWRFKLLATRAWPNIEALAFTSRGGREEINSAGIIGRNFCLVAFLNLLWDLFAG